MRRATMTLLFVCALVWLVPASALARKPGTMSQEHADIVVAQLQDSRPKLAHCEPEEPDAPDAEEHAAPAGKEKPIIVEVRVWIAESGRVSSATVTESDAPSWVNACVRKELLSWRFPPYENAVRVVTRWYF